LTITNGKGIFKQVAQNFAGIKQGPLLSHFNQVNDIKMVLGGLVSCTLVNPIPYSVLSKNKIEKIPALYHYISCK
jgi:hypothetical protein